MRTKFQEWYSNVILNQLDNDLEEEIDRSLSRMKPLTAQWIIEIHDYFVKHPSIIINGFREAGIQEILKKMKNIHGIVTVMCKLILIIIFNNKLIH